MGTHHSPSDELAKSVHAAVLGQHLPKLSFLRDAKLSRALQRSLVGNHKRINAAWPQISRASREPQNELQGQSGEPSLHHLVEGAKDARSSEQV